MENSISNSKSTPKIEPRPKIPRNYLVLMVDDIIYPPFYYNTFHLFKIFTLIYNNKKMNKN